MPTSSPNLARRLLTWLGIVLALNLALAVIGAPVIEIGGFRFPAQNVYKPLLLLDGAIVVIALLVAARKPGEAAAPEFTFPLKPPLLYALLAALVVAAYLPAFDVNFLDHDWTHRHISRGLTSFAAIARLLYQPQVDGMYRPLAFLDFALDYRLFGGHLWAYHLQSIALHVLNAALLYRLAAALGFRRAVASFAACIFGLGAVHFEAVLWPAARFDLLAAAFASISLVFFLAHWRAGRFVSRAGVLSLVSFAIAVLNKETAYSIVLIVPVLIATGRHWNLPRFEKVKAALYMGALAATAGALVLVRLLIFGNIGGYNYSAATAGPMQPVWKSLYLLVVNVLALSTFGINTSDAASPSAKAVLLLLVAFAAAFAMLYRGRAGKTLWILAGLALVSAVPAYGVIGWIRPSLEHSRHLYWPSLWTSLMLAGALAECARSRVLAALFLLLQIVGLDYNLLLYRSLSYENHAFAAEVVRAAEEASVRPSRICLIGVPNSPGGVMLFSSEVEAAVADKLPSTGIALCDSLANCPEAQLPGTLVYTWQGRR